MKTYLNLGCGQRFNPNWTNVDFHSSNPNVIEHNLLKGIPFADESFDVIYHSHVLEHFSKIDGEIFMKECYRVLKKNGIIRIAVPDLEGISREYLKQLESSLSGNIDAEYNYQWMIIELIDQMARHNNGGEMIKYLQQESLANEEFVYNRIGEEGKNLRKYYLENRALKKTETYKYIDKRNIFLKFLSKIKLQIKSYLFKNEMETMRLNNEYLQIGKFRKSGEIHFWMYDRYSLSKLLQNLGFQQIEIKTASESKIPDWNNYELELRNGLVLKPDSLYIEAKKH